MVTSRKQEKEGVEDATKRESVDKPLHPALTSPTPPTLNLHYFSFTRASFSFAILL